MIDFNILGRPDGLGNRLEELIIADAYSAKQNHRINYIWNNKFKHRSYNIRITAKNVNLSTDAYLGVPTKTLNELELHLFTREEILGSAKNINPTFSINFANNIKPTGIHIRGTDRISNNGHPHFMQNEEEFISYLSKTIDIINTKSPEYLFVCADDNNIRKVFIKHLNKKINVVNPSYDRNVEREYVDFFALSLCQEIYMCSKFSSFAITASMIGNIPIFSLYRDKEVADRYKALFQYELDISHNNKLFQNIKKTYSISKKNNTGCKFKTLLSRLKNFFN